MQTIPLNDDTFFITFTCYKWLPLIGKINGEKDLLEKLS